MNEKQMVAVCIKPRPGLTKGKVYSILLSNPTFVTVVSDDNGWTESYYRNRFSFVDISGSIEDLL